MKAVLLWLAVWAAADTQIQLREDQPDLEGKAAEPCRAVKGLGCVYVPDGAGDDLIVFLRGDRLNGEPEKNLASARYTFDRYGLRAAADRARQALFVTGEETIGIGLKEAGEIGVAAGRSTAFAGYLVASHSNGKKALLKDKTLALSPLRRVDLLDTSYFGQDGADRVNAALKREGAACAGFVTEEKSAKFHRKLKLDARCGIDDQSRAKGGCGHFDGVNYCLAAYLSGGACPRPGKKTACKSPAP